jgi:predicted AlkP superfamily phosphohydrolase/phosphomutase
VLDHYVNIKEINSSPGFAMRVLVIGFDGASPRLIEDLIGGLPTFRHFRNNGIYGLSVPPVPAQTPVAWTTFMTGKNPGKHGIFSFATRIRGTYDRRIINPDMMRSKTLWRILSDNGKRVGVINVPMATLERINGFMIPGFLSRYEGHPYPSNVKRKLEEKFGPIEKVAGDVETNILEIVKDDPDRFFNRIDEITDELFEISLYLLETERWDFFMVVFMGTDRIQHFFWKYMNEKHPVYGENEYRVRIKEFYEKMDRILETYLNATPSDTIIILLSDHGFCSVQKELLLNNYLKDYGFLKTVDGKIALAKSRAVSYGYGDIWLNLKGREPNGLVDKGRDCEEIKDEIIKNLQNLEIQGQSPIKRVDRRESVYWGPFVKNAPDLITIFNPGWQAARTPEISNTFDPHRRYVVEEPRWTGGHDGTHDPGDVPGILAINGPGICRMPSIRANLYDLAPTILSILQLPIPMDMDGSSILTKKEM